MFESQPGPSRSPRGLALFTFALLAGSGIPLVQGLRTTSGSPCASICHKLSPNTTASQIACLDSQFNNGKGKDFEDCITCQLESTYVDRLSGETDVDWGLYNLRYAFTSCVFGYPEIAANISTPCTVGCGGIQAASELNLLDPSADNFHNWCGSTGFADNSINSCEFCYNLTYSMGYQQVYIANFLESIRYDCHLRTAVGYVFGIAPSRIFSDVLLPSTLSLATTSPSKPGPNLGIVIAIPIVGFLILVLGLAGCCYFFIRWRRRRRAGRGRRQNPPFDMWHDPSHLQPQQGPGGAGYSPQMYSTGYTGQAQNPEYGPGFGISFASGHGQGHSPSDEAKNSYSYELRETSPSDLHPTMQIGGHGYEVGRKTPYMDQITQSPSSPSAYVSPQAGAGHWQFQPDQKPPL
ncbi:hypothetical protein N7539_006662 [Penicillium diatomitis]|uniref:LPXTG-domain-containing protein n=1 Tax=Penicillium diatomitis TaxID=2819901 RepID=A0A9W9X1L4_9EURO|nr:uncharacterized protein N7539_006662 [Penicillium diatomitis]KAJ5480768.1 hypothetical protein N7539_006662 [Penicillium diatomitis]